MSDTTIVTSCGKEMSGADVHVAMFGTVDYEITKLSYDMSQEHTASHSLGSNDATSYSMGKKTYSCTLGLRGKSIDAIEKACKCKLVDIKPFSIIVNALNDENESITDRIICKFADQGREYDSSSNDNKREFKMFVLRIDFNI
jgi:hypothetical protein